MMDLEAELKKNGDEIIHELSIIETKKGNFYVILPEDFDDPAQVEKVGALICQLIVNWTLRIADVITIMKEAITKKGNRVIPVTTLPKDLKL